MSGRDLGGRLDRREAVAGLLQVEARDVLERRGDQLADEGVVVDDEDRRRHAIPSRMRANASSGIVS